MSLGLANPAALLALGAVAVLVLLHLRTRRRNVIPVATLLLWRQVPAAVLEPQRFRPDLLFALRVALVLAVVAGLLRPYLERPAVRTAAGRLVLVLDLSASMQTRESEGTRFEIARRRARSLVAALAPGEAAMVVTAAARAHVAVRWTTEHARVQARLEALEPLDLPTNLAPALALALGETAAETETRITVLTDLPPDASGLGEDEIATLDWVQIGSAADNLALAGLTVEQAPFRPASEASVSVLVRSHADEARRAVVAAHVEDRLWARRDVVLPPRASREVRLERPPAAGVVAVALEGGDVLAADDRAYGWIAPETPLAVTLTSAAPERLRELVAALPGARVVEDGGGIAVLDGVAPPVPGTGSALYLAPPAGGPCPVEGTADAAAVIDWDGEHPIAAGLAGLEALEVERAQVLVRPAWATSVVLAGSQRSAFPLLLAGERNGRRIACLAVSPTEPAAASDRLPLLLLTLGTLHWLAEPLATTALSIATGMPALLDAPAAPAPGLHVAGDPPVAVAERVGAWRLDARRVVLANLFDDRESDVGRRGAREWPAQARPARATPARSDLGWWCYALALLLLGFEWLVWERRARAATGGRGRALARVCRGLAVTALGLVLAGAHVTTTRPAAGICLVAAVDASASVQRAAAARARTFLAEVVSALGPDDLVGSVVFSAEARVATRPVARADPAALVPEPDPGTPDAADTDLAAALVRAAPLCPAGRQAAVVLVTDGNETTGSLLAEATVADTTIPVHALVPPRDALPPVVVRRLLAPTLAPERTVLPLEAVIENRSGRRLSAALQLTANGRPVAGEPDGRSARLQFVDLPPGVSVVPLPYRLADPGGYLLEAALLLAPDLPPSPAPGRAAVTVTRPVQVLAVSERETPIVATVLAEREMQVERVAPTALAVRLAAGPPPHLVVLDDVGRAGLADETLAALADWVDAGGALVVAGGPHLFGDPGFVGSALERVLPVQLQAQTPEPREREPIALYLLIDRSNSMGYASGADVAHGEKMEYAKRAALAVLEQLGDEDLVGAVAFDAQPYLLAPLASVRANRAALTARIRQLQYGGGTDFRDALDLALQALAGSARRVRHVILLTDGDTNRRAADHVDLIAALARVEISVTTIRIGSDTANLELLHGMSRATHGQFHHVERVHALPQLLISDTRRQIDLAAGREGLRVRVGEPGPMLAGLTEDELPPVARWAVTRLRPGAELRLYVDGSERRDPILATWQHGLGRVAVVPLDFQAGAAAWAAWPGFAKLWTQLVLWAIPPGVAGDRHLEARRTRTGTLVRVETLAAEPGPIALALGDGPEALLRPAGARRWEGLLGPLAPGPHAATLVTGRGREAVHLIVPAASPSGRELAPTEPNWTLLRQVTALTGGRIDPTPADLLQARSGTERRTAPLEPWLGPLGLVLILAGIGVGQRTG